VEKPSAGTLTAAAAKYGFVFGQVASGAGDDRAEELQLSHSRQIATRPESRTSVSRRENV